MEPGGRSYGMLTCKGGLPSVRAAVWPAQSGAEAADSPKPLGPGW
jgi:hypothetical protein